MDREQQWTGIWKRKTILMKFALSFYPQFHFPDFLPVSWVVAHTRKSKSVKMNQNREGRKNREVLI